MVVNMESCAPRGSDKFQLMAVYAPLINGVLTFFVSF